MILLLASFSCFFSFFLKAFLFLFFLERKGSKRKSSAEQLLFAAVVFFANMLHKTDGSHTNRPFFSFHVGHTGKRLFSDKSTVPQCLLFLFFKKRNRSLLFFLEEKKQKKINCGTVILCRSRRFCRRATQNGRLVCEPSVFSFHAGHAGKRLFSDKSTVPQCLLFLFFKKRNRPLSEEKNRPSITSTARRGSRQQPSCPRPLRGSRLQRRSQRLRPHTRTACSSCRSPHRQ